MDWAEPLRMLNVVVTPIIYPWSCNSLHTFEFHFVDLSNIKSPSLIDYTLVSEYQKNRNKEQPFQKAGFPNFKELKHHEFLRRIIRKQLPMLIVDLHGNFIACSSRVYRGSSFWGLRFTSNTMGLRTVFGSEQQHRSKPQGPSHERENERTLYETPWRESNGRQRTCYWWEERRRCCRD